MTRVDCEGLADGHVNMARDLLLLDEVRCGGVLARVYGWDGPWVTLGKLQKPGRVFVEVCEVPWVQRPTGGKAVLHGHDVTVGLAASLETLGLEERRIGPVYRAVIGPLVEALNSVGIEAVLAEETPFVRGGGKLEDCFRHVSANDVVDPSSGLKVCGCALRIVSDAVLVQASIPVGTPLVDPKAVFAEPFEFAGERAVSRDEFAAALESALVAVL